MKLTITGRPISKKRQYRSAKGGGFYLSKTWKNFVEDAGYQVLEQKPGKIIKHCHADYTFYIKGKYHVDIDNLIVSMNDLLQDVNVLDDDDLITSISAKKIGGCGGWSTKINIEEI